MQQASGSLNEHAMLVSTGRNILVYIKTYAAQTHLYVADHDGKVVTLKHEDVIAAVARSHHRVARHTKFAPQVLLVPTCVSAIV